MNASCPHCGGEVANDGTLALQNVACPYCTGQFVMPPQPPPAPIPYMLPAVKTKRHNSRSRSGGTLNPALAVILSLVLVGLPQMLMGQAIKGVVMLIVGVILGALTGCLACLIIWPVGMIDAYCIAQKLRDGRRVGEWEFF